VAKSIVACVACHSAGSRHRTHRSRDGSHRASREGAQPRGPDADRWPSRAPRGCRDRAGSRAELRQHLIVNRRARSVRRRTRTTRRSKPEARECARVASNSGRPSPRHESKLSAGPRQVDEIDAIAATASTRAARRRSGSNFVDPMYPKSQSDAAVRRRARGNRTGRAGSDRTRFPPRAWRRRSHQQDPRGIVAECACRTVCRLGALRRFDEFPKLAQISPRAEAGRPSQQGIGELDNRVIR